MSTELIEDQKSPIWKKLYSIWVQEGRPGTVVAGGSQYKVLQPSEEEVKFEPQGGFDHYYGSQSKSY